MMRAAPLLVVALGLCLSACGGAGKRPQEPAISARAANDLAGQAEAIAASFESGAVCTAAKQADTLEAAVSDAIAAGEVPPALRARLEQAATTLVNEINCPPPAPAAEDPSTTDEQAQDCGQLEEQKQALGEERDAKNGKAKGRRKQVERELKALEKEIKAACGDRGEDE